MTDYTKQCIRVVEDLEQDLRDQIDVYSACTNGDVVEMLVSFPPLVKNICKLSETLAKARHVIEDNADVTRNETLTRTHVLENCLYADLDPNTAMRMAATED